MKKNKRFKFFVIGIIVLIIVIILAVIFANTSKKENKNVISNEIVEPVTESEEIVENIEEAQVNPTDYKGYTASQWKLLIEKFYKEYMSMDLDNVICEYNDNGEYTAKISSDNVVCGEFLFDDETGYAKEKYSDITIDFINGQFANRIKNEDAIFKDNIILAMAYLKDSSEQKLMEKYFNSQSSYNSITTYDFRGEESSYGQFKEKYIFIPKDDSVSISIYNCKTTDDESVKKQSQLIENMSTPFAMIFEKEGKEKTDLFMELKVDGSTTIIPISLNNNGQLDLSKYKKDVVDISVYE